MPVTVCKLDPQHPRPTSCCHDGIATASGNKAPGHSLKGNTGGLSETVLSFLTLFCLLHFLFTFYSINKKSSQLPLERRCLYTVPVPSKYETGQHLFLALGKMLQEEIIRRRRHGCDRSGQKLRPSKNHIKFKPDSTSMFKGKDSSPLASAVVVWCVITGDHRNP